MMRHITVGLSLAGALQSLRHRRMGAAAAAARLAADRTSRQQRGRRQARAGAGAAASPPPPTRCRSISSRRRRASTSSSMPAACRTRARWRSAPRARCSSARAFRTRSMPSSTRTAKREVKVLVSGLYRPNGVAFKDGTLYIAELSQISKIENVEDKLDDRRSRPSSTAICRRTRRTAGNIWPSARTTSCISRSASRATTSLHDKNHGQLRRIESRRQRRRGHRLRHPQHRRVRLESAKRRALFHRQRPRLAVRGPAQRQAQPDHQARRGFRRAVFAIRATFPTSNSAGAIAAANSCRRSP